MTISPHALCLLLVAAGPAPADPAQAKAEEDCVADIQFEDDPAMTRVERLQAMDAAYHDAVNRARLCLNETGQAGKNSDGSVDAADTTDAGKGEEAGSGAREETADAQEAGEAPQGAETVDAREVDELPQSEDATEAREMDEPPQGEEIAAWEPREAPAEVPDDFENSLDSAPSAFLSGTEILEETKEQSNWEDLIPEIPDNLDPETGERQSMYAKIRKPPMGPGRVPQDIPSADNDDTLARQIRAAAEAEDDPEKRKRLWNEYRNYKKLPLQP